jgi:hypothetical protein
VRAARATIVWFDVQHNAQIGEFGRQILVLAGQGLARRCGCSAEGEGGAAFRWDAGCGAAGLAEQGLFVADVGACRQALHFFD